MPNETMRIEVALHEWVAALDTVKELIFMHDAQGNILRANLAYADRAGLDVRQVIGRPYWEVFPRIAEKFPLCPPAERDNQTLVKEVRLETGEIFVSYGYPLQKTRDGERASVHVLHDVTEDRRREKERQAQIDTLAQVNEDLSLLNAQLAETQSQLIQTEKLASLGELAAGVAHEINNPVGFVQSNLGTLDSYVKSLLELIEVYEELELHIDRPGAALKRVRELKSRIDLPFLRTDLPSLLVESVEGLHRVSKIVQDLKNFSHRDQEDQWEFEDLHRGIDSTINVVWNELKNKCELHKEYGHLPLVECLLSQLNQVFLNLLVNAAHAIKDQGVVTIRSGVQDDEVWIEVSDTGCGIPPPHLHRIFEPFFTTKPMGEGTGLGLSVSYSIIKKHHGRIEVQSQLGAGTTFRLWLPIRQPPRDT